ncbi:hypothetical protein V1512DRAFT_203597 [Lipomyces arxii]|uniref:uncharacterized protein n=1 Tax=Lipomyces arxii TaxID=56418 RepID=UPI0034CEE64C
MLDSADLLQSFSIDGVQVGTADFGEGVVDPDFEENSESQVDNESMPPPRSVSPVKVTRKPFNFQSTVASRSPVNKTSQRRGHKYKHSSVSMNFFQEPPPRPPPVLPAHFPVPNHKDAIQSMSRDQKIQMSWCCLHFFIGSQLWLISYESTTLMALSHIIYFDAFAATLSVTVDVLSNFEVWKTSSIRHPFGLQRAEILAGFASAVGILFMGFDIGSHLCENFVKKVIAEAVPHDHEAERFFARGSSFVIMMAMFVTVVSSIVFKNHERTGTAVQFSYIRKLPYGLNNPLYMTTISSCLLLLSLPIWTSEPWYGTVDSLSAVAIAFMMCFVGWMTALTLGRMLLMGFDGACAQMILKELQADADIKSVEESRMWTVHYGLCIINIRLKLQGPHVNENLVRTNVNRIIGDVLKANMGAIVSQGDPGGFTSSDNNNGTKAKSSTSSSSSRAVAQWEGTIDIDYS